MRGKDIYTGVWAFWIFLLCGSLGSSGVVAGRERIVPDPIAVCLSRPEVRPYGHVDFLINPYYIRGDFDGDGRNDYVPW